MEILLRIALLFWKIRHRIKTLLGFRTAPVNLEKKTKEWNSVHQRFELRYHTKSNYRWDDSSFYRQWDLIFKDFLGLTYSSFDREKTILDIGCGSRPAFDWFRDSAATKYYLDPLLTSFQSIPKMSAFWRDKKNESLLSIPAEINVKELNGCCDFTLCWNVLDHSYDWFSILRNIAAYSRERALVCIGTDFTSHGIGHPGIDDKDQFYDFVKAYFNVEKEVAHCVNRDIGLKLIRNSRPL